MTVFVSYAVSSSPQPVDGDEIASMSGWAAFQAWAAALPDDYPELGYLGEFAECFSAAEDDSAIATLQADLERALALKPGNPSPAVLHIAERLLAEIRERPKDATALVVTDGVSGEE